MWIKRHFKQEEADDGQSAFGAGAPSGDPASDDPTSDGDPGTPTIIEDGWLKGVDAELASDKIMEHIKDVPSLVKSYVHAQRMIGHDKVVLPTDKSSQEEWNDIYKKLGMPDAEKYEIKQGEESNLDSEFVKSFKELALQNNILPKQAQAIMDFYESQMSEEIQRETAEMKEAAASTLNKLKEDWGEGYQASMQRVLDAVETFGGEEMVNYLKTSPAGNDVNLLKFLEKVGSSLKEDTFDGEATRHFGLTKDEAQRQIDTIMGDFSHPYHNSEHAGHQRALEDMKKYFQVVS